MGDLPVEEQIAADTRTFFIIFAVLGALTAVLLWAFIDGLVWGVFTGYVLYVFNDWLRIHVENPQYRRFILISFFVVFAAAVSAFFVQNIPRLTALIQEANTILTAETTQVMELFNIPASFQGVTVDALQNAVQTVRNRFFTVLGRLPLAMIEFVMYIAVSLAVFDNAAAIKNKINALLDNFHPRERTLLSSFIASLEDVFRGVFVTQALLSIVIGVIAFTGFTVIGYIFLGHPIPFALPLSILIGVFAFLPIVGAPVVYVTMAAVYWMQGMPWLAFTITVFGLLGLNAVPEFYLKPVVGAKRVDEPRIVLFIGFLAGPVALGGKGIILGPVILILFKEFFNAYAALEWDAEHVSHANE